MAKLILFVFSISVFLYSQSDLKVQVTEAIPSSNQIDWGVDNAIIGNEPLGSFSGVQKSDGTIYVAVNDTISTVNLGLVIFQSTDDGSTWTLFPSGINYRGYYEKIKMLRSGLDSIYCSFQISNFILTWNILSGNFGQLYNGNYRTYDIVASSTGNLYAFVDSLTTNHIPRYASTNGGATWPIRALVTSNGAHPKVFMSGTGDTLTLNYYGPVLPDTATSIIRSARYRETGPGILSVTGSFADIATEVDYKKEFKSVINNGEVWFFYTLGPDGARNIMARKSSDNGTTFDPAITLAGNPNTDEYGFDADFWSTGSSSGFDFIYYSDSAQTGPPTNATDILYYTTAGYGSSTFGSLEKVSENPPVYSPYYSPSILPMHYSSGDVAALWVGDDGATMKLFWDQLSAIIPVELTSFTASSSGNDVVLNWTTATETNNYGFQVERAFSLQGWQEIAFVPGFGTTTEPRMYSYTDSELNPGTYSYRIKQIDLNGSFTYYELGSAVEISTPEVFELAQNYPNPFNPATRIDYSIAEATNVQLIIFNSIGEEITVVVNEFQQPGRYAVNFDAKSLSSGVYFYKLIAGDFISIKKMLLMK
jgi:hypothetical protein